MTTGRIPSVEGGIQPTIIDAAGDLIYGASNDTPARLAIGTAGQVLTVNTGATAPQWATIAASKPSFYPPKRTGLFLSTPGQPVGNVTAVEDRTYYLPIYLPTCTLDRISCLTGSTFSGTSTVRLGIYNADSTTNLPSTVLLDAGTISCTASGTSYRITINQAITEGFYWLAFNSQTPASTNAFEGLTGSLGQVNVSNMRLATSEVEASVGFIQNSVTGAFGAFSYSDVAGNSPFVYVRQA